jgi:hypothetical protein
MTQNLEPSPDRAFPRTPALGGLWSLTALPTGSRSTSALLRFGALAGASLLLVACASTTTDAQWVDPAVPAQTLRGERVFIACTSQETVVRQICQDQLAQEVTARGATPVRWQQQGPTDRNPEVYMADARASGARAVLSVDLAPGGTGYRPGMSIGIGLGSFGRGGLGGGVGVSAPVGGGQYTTSYTADSRISDAGTGRVMWTARTSSRASADVQTQLVDLARDVVGTAQKAGLF